MFLQQNPLVIETEMEIEVYLMPQSQSKREKITSNESRRNEECNLNRILIIG